MTDAENKNGADYQHDLELIESLLSFLLHLQEILEQNPVKHPLAIRAYNSVLFGLIPVINVNCPHDPDCKLNAGQPCGGISDAYDTLEAAIEALDLELLYEGGENDATPSSDEG